MTAKSKEFWSSLPGIFTGFAAIITAVTGLYIAVNNTDGSEDKKTESSDVLVPISNTSSGMSQSNENNNVLSSGVRALTEEDIAQLEETERKEYEKLPQTKLKSLVDCTLFPTVNMVKTLISWSDNYHKKITASKGNKDQIMKACNKAIDYRGMAHCKAPNDLNVRQALYETLMLCRTEGIEWTDIKHTSIQK